MPFSPSARLPNSRNPQGHRAYPIAKVGIIGAGTMGGGIAMACANAGISVLLKETEQAALDRGIATVRKNYESSVKKGRFPQAVMDQRMALIHPQLTYDGFEQADIVIEAAFESMAVKKQLFGEIDKSPRRIACWPRTLRLSISTKSPQRLRARNGHRTHFFSPAHVMRLVEIVRGKAHQQRSDRHGAGVGEEAEQGRRGGGQLPGLRRESHDAPYMREAQFLVEEGATPAQVDRALNDFGMAMGIFAVDDMGGIDLAGACGRNTRICGNRAFAGLWCWKSSTKWAATARRPGGMVSLR